VCLLLVPILTVIYRYFVMVLMKSKRNEDLCFGMYHRLSLYWYRTLSMYTMENLNCIHFVRFVLPQYPGCEYEIREVLDASITKKIADISNGKSREFITGAVLFRYYLWSYPIYPTLPYLLSWCDTV
jgi:hypothetical protein